MKKTWADLDFWKSEEWQKVRDFLYENVGKYCPEPEDIFRSLILCPLQSVKVVILGQDPYFRKGQADGLAFSTKDKYFPPSLVNIFKEMRKDLNCNQPLNGDLSPWARQGVLLLNKYLTVEEGRPLSHAHIGWQKLSDEIVETVAQVCPDAVFILWGNEAKKVLPLIGDSSVVFGNHPSPLSAINGGFFGTRPFSNTNDNLRRSKQEPIDWNVPEFKIPYSDEARNVKG